MNRRSEVHAMRKQIKNESCELRPSVRTFAQMMELTLRRHNDTKGNQSGANGRSGWRQDFITESMSHLESEVSELREEVDNIRKYGIGCEAIHVACMAMMVWDKALQLSEATNAAKPQKEGLL